MRAGSCWAQPAPHRTLSWSGHTLGSADRADPALTINSGGQTGVDRGALDAALAAGAPCGGWCPARRRAEDGRIQDRYPLRETPSADYTERTRWNVRDSDGTVILSFGALSGGTALTQALCAELGRPCVVIEAARTTPEEAAAAIRRFVAAHAIRVLNVAGPRASEEAGAYGAARAVVTRVLDA
jgi:hypothetical protein